MSEIIIDGKALPIDAEPAHQNLLRFLREQGITGPKEGCAEGDCGACTCLLIDETEERKPRAFNACIAPLQTLAGREVITVEGLRGEDGSLHPAQQAMVDHLGSQCGYCTPGFVCSLAEAATWEEKPDDEQIADLLCGNLCRCTGYRPIRDAAHECLERGGDLSLTRSPAHGSPPALHPAFRRPTSVPELLDLLADHPETRIVAGATEIGVEINKLGRTFPRLVSTERVPELRAISYQSGEGWQIGGGATLTEIEEALGGRLPIWDEMSRVFASRQIRNRATLAGNLATASPIGDTPPVLLALGATLTLESRDGGQRRVPVANFFQGYRQTALDPGEIIRSVFLPELGKGAKAAFSKVSKRREMDIAIVSSAFAIETDDEGVVCRARLAYGGVAATPARVPEVEELLLGQSLEDSLEAAKAALREAFTPLDDHRGSAAYRRGLVVSLWEKFVRGGEPARAATTPDSRPPLLGTPHESAVGHVTGESRYVEDIALRQGNCLHAWPVLSTHARARITRMDSEAARSLPGVAAILTADDVPGLNNVGPIRHDEPLFAEEEVFYHGQILALVLAETRDQAKLAAAAFEVDYEPIAPLLGLEKAIAEGSFHTEPHVLSRGDAKAALAGAPHILEGTFEFGGQEQFYLETQAAMAEPEDDGSFFVRSSTQHPSEVQAICAEVMGLQRNQITVEAPRMGGGFGGKETQGNPWAAAMCIGAQRTGRPCCVQLDRDVDMATTGKRHPFHARFRVGFDEAGQLLACEVDLVSDGGWALDLSVPVTDRALFHLDNAYYLPHVRFTGRVARTNTCSNTAFRGFGGPQGMLVIEEIVSRVAGSLGLPPEQVRARNFYHGEGETATTHYGADIGHNRLGPIWEGLLATSDFAVRRRAIDEESKVDSGAIRRGLAITPVKFGISFTLRHYNQAGALVLLYADGTCQVNHGGTEMGQGLHTKIRGVAMRALGLPAEKVRCMHTRTDKVPNTSATAASSSTDLNGAAVLDACEKLLGRLRPVAAERLGCDPEEVEFTGDAARSDTDSIPFAELCTRAYSERVQLSATGFYKTPALEWDWEVGKGQPFFYYAYGAAVTEVEVDFHTGMHRVVRCDILHDVGDSLNPAIDRGQIEGGFVQGMGWLTGEELRWSDDGRLLTHSASTYAIPAFSDAPADFRVDLFKADTDSQPDTVGRSKAVGEPPLMLAISVREALRDAVRKHRGDGAGEITELPSPATCEAVYRASRSRDT